AASSGGCNWNDWPRWPRCRVRPSGRPRYRCFPGGARYRSGACVQFTRTVLNWLQGSRCSWSRRWRLGGPVAYADQTFLRGGGDQPAVAAEDLPARQPAAALGGGAVERIQQPLVDAERTMEPQRMVEAGHLHVARHVGNAMRQRGRADQVEIRRIGEQRTMENRRIVDRCCKPEPDVLDRRP